MLMNRLELIRIQMYPGPLHDTMSFFRLLPRVMLSFNKDNFRGRPGGYTWESDYRWYWQKPC